MQIKVTKTLTIKRWRLCLGGFFIYWNVPMVDRLELVRQFGIVFPFRGSSGSWSRPRKEGRKIGYVLYNKPKKAPDAQQ